MAGDRDEVDWVGRFADEILQARARSGAEGPVICASGISPSGPIHLGNLREIMTPHLVADELRRRGVPCGHLLSWDDYDRFRRVPAGIDPAWEQYVGRPLTAVPAPPGSDAENWAEHFKAPMQAALAELGVEVREISQTAMYRSGAYREQILLAMRERKAIDAILGRYRTKQGTPAASAAEPNAAPVEADVEAARGSVEVVAEDDAAPSTGEYFPYRPYCTACQRDTTTITRYDDASTELTYTCECGHGETVLLREFDSGKLVWKVDWPMRWAYEGVAFEPAGVDHSSPGSSFTVGRQLVREIFDAQPPIGPMYAFVGIAGMAKMSSSKGFVPTPADALAIMETPVLRWLYSRRRPNQSFTISFDEEIHRIYDQWDALQRRVRDGSAAAPEQLTYARSVATTARELPLTAELVPYRTLTSVIDVTTGNPDQLLRVLGNLGAVHSLDAVRPRLDRALTWVETQMAAEDRTRVRAEPDADLLASLSESEREGLALLAQRLDDDWSLEGLTGLVYGVPKVQLGLPMDVAPSPELKAAQRAFFALLYRLLVGRDTGPRLPTLLLAVGAERVRALIAPTG